MRFTLLSSSDMQRLSHVHVVNKALYLQDNSREPALYGVLDRRMVSAMYRLIIEPDWPFFGVALILSSPSDKV